MKKKILSALLALSLLGQSALAATNLRDFVSTTYDPSHIDGDGLFSYELVTGHKVHTTVTAEAGDSPSYSTGTAGVVQSTINSFDYKVSLDMTNVKTAFNALSSLVRSEISGQGLDANFDGSLVTGQFVVDVAFDSGMTFTAANITLGQVDVSSAETIFRMTGIDEATPRHLKVSFDIKDGIIVTDLAANSNKALNDLYATLDNVTVANPNTVYNVTAQLESAVVYLSDIVTADILSDKRYGTITFDSDSSTIGVKYTVTPPSPSGPSGGGVSLTPKFYTVVDTITTEIPTLKDGVRYHVDISEIETPVKEGYIFDGWYLDKDFKDAVTGDITITKTTYLYAKFIQEAPPTASVVIDGEKTDVPVSTEDGKIVVNVDDIEPPEREGFAFDGWYTDPTLTEKAEGTVEITEDTHFYPNFINLTAPNNLISDDHIAYIYGYPDGEVKPNGNITREEVVAAFYRLLKPDYRATIETAEHSFPDINADRWSVEEIATMANGGYIVGDQNGNFNPAKPITRAEFVTIAVKFMESDAVPNANYFTDVSGHWAEESIKKAAYSFYWILGYADGTFRPNNFITRAEAMTIINKMLVRYGDHTSEHAEDWPDLSETDWFYSNVIEATTHNHTFDRHDNGWSETWTGIIE